MSRVAKAAITIEKGIEVSMSGSTVTAKGKLGQLSMDVNSAVVVVFNDDQISFIIAKVEKKAEKLAWAQAGTARANTANLIQGVSVGWEKKLSLIGVGYRAKAMGKSLDLTLGFSHPVVYALPEGITVETPSQTEIVVKGMDKQKVGQVAAEIRAFRPPEPYKGKGVRYTDEHVVRKEAKKK
ncbi:50S ribosomal protein L6 [Candidatus Thioglobus sp.]|nr:50S ribosomal protein L6 [Candidatus Thioglobus sp.]